MPEMGVSINLIQYVLSLSTLYLTRPSSSMCLVLWGTSASTFVAGESREHHIAYENPDRRQNRGLINKGNPEFPKSEAGSTTPPTSTSSSNLFKNTRIIGGEEVSAFTVSMMHTFTVTH